MAGGMLTKQAIMLTARYLNTVNDTVSGGAIFALPSGVQPPAWSQTIPGDRLVLDDVSALALSDTTNTGTLYGGVFINGNAAPAVPLVKGNFGWIQVAGVASFLPDSTLTSTALATTISAKVSATVASSCDAGVALTTVTLANVL